MSFIVEYIDGIEKEHSKKEYYNTGQIISEIINDNEIKNYYPNGKLKKHTDKNFIKEYYPNGVLKLNKVDSLSEHFFENGSLKIREIKTDVYNNTFIEYYKKSKLKSKRIIRFDYWLIEEYNLEGNLIEFSKTDSIHIKRDPSTLQLLLKGEFVGNNRDGVWKHYYENGKIKILETYMYGEKYGDCKEFFDNGKLKERGYYKYGEKYGVFKTYYVNGKLKEKAVYEDDNLHGEYMEYYNNGKLKTIGNYYEGNRIKLFKYFNKDGTLNSAKTY